MTTLSYTLPVAGSTLNQTADPELVTAFNTTQAWANGNIDGANVVASITGRRLIAQAAAVFPASTTSGTYFLLGDGSIVKSGSTTTKSILWWYLDPGNFAVAGKANTQAIIRMSLGASANSNSVTFNGTLQAFSLGATGANLTPSVGATVGTGAGATPASGSTTVAESSGGVFTFPSAGAYCPLVTLTANMGASDIVTVLWQLYVLNS